MGNGQWATGNGLQVWGSRSRRARDEGVRTKGEVWGKSRGAHVKPWAKPAPFVWVRVTTSRPLAHSVLVHVSSTAERARPSFIK